MKPTDAPAPLYHLLQGKNNPADWIEVQHYKVEAKDVGITLEQFAGNAEKRYTFETKDINREISVLTKKSRPDITEGWYFRWTVTSRGFSHAKFIDDIAAGVSTPMQGCST